MPEPRDDETRDEFLDRFMASEEAISDFPDGSRRFAVAVSVWDEVVRKDEPRTLYVSRPIVNSKELLDWAASQGLKNLVSADELHVTLVYSRQPVDWFRLTRSPQQEVVVPPGDPRVIYELGDEGAIVLRFQSIVLERRNQQLLDSGASSDHDEYRPHVTITFDASGIDLDEVEPFRGAIILGPEIWEQLPVGHGSVLKLDTARRIVYGWAYLVKDVDGKQVVDHSGDFVPDAQNLEDVAVEYVLKSREGDVMHDMVAKSALVESFVLTPEKATEMGIKTDRVGWWVGFKVLDDKVWKRVVSGELKMFSIHGSGIRTKVEA